MLVLGLAACSPKPPVPIVVLENPATHERVRFFREITFEVLVVYDEARHIAQWRAEQEAKGYTVEVKP